MNQGKHYPGTRPFSPEEKRSRITRHKLASEYLSLLGLELSDLEPGYCRLKMPFRKEFTHSGGVVQGGILTTLADSCIAHAAIAALDSDAVITTTLELKINFIRPATTGTFIAEARMIHIGRRTAVGEAEITDERGKLIAKCISTLLILPREIQSGERREKPEEGNSDIADEAPR